MGPLFSAGLLLLGSMACLLIAFVAFRFFLSAMVAFMAAAIFVLSSACAAALAAAVLSLLMPETLTSSLEVIVFLSGIGVGGLGLGSWAAWKYVKGKRFNMSLDTDAARRST